ncbi:integrase domain-containing protein [Neptuniibacter halophilus]|uniref:integrase domain-containing protein n=1 Tax=Neptuniibacter halophilus TaxID=651666 RepID=UPI002573649A|nr:integrase domain-containing protein [Neptuniibacter halophilus]
MARKTLPLTNTQVKNAKPADKEYNLSDGEGLALRVKPNGSKIWIFNYTRPHIQKRANISFGTYPEVSIADARKKRFEARALLAEKIDPQQKRDADRQEQMFKQVNTLTAVVESWFELKKNTISTDYADDIINSLKNHVLPKLGNYPVADITAPLVIDVLKPLAGSGKLEMTKRICSRLNQVMTFATNTGLVQSNPLVGIKQAFKSPTVTNNPTLKPDELPLLMSQVADANIRLVTRLLIRWQLHTMTRPGEAAGAKWDEIDLEKGVWVIPAERMKKRREHIVPLTSQTISILEKLRLYQSNSPYLFPSDLSIRKPINASTANVALKRMGFKDRLTAHGMRSIASTALNEQGFDPDLIEAALAHTDKNQVRATYNRASYLERRKEMMQWWSDQITKAQSEGL